MSRSLNPALDGLSHGLVGREKKSTEGDGRETAMSQSFANFGYPSGGNGSKTPLDSPDRWDNSPKNYSYHLISFNNSDVDSKCFC